MTRKVSHLIAAGFGALSMVAGAAVYAHDAPLSVNEAGPVAANHEVAPSNAAPAAVGRTSTPTQSREVRGSYTFEVHTPSSVNESAPWLAGQPARR